MSVPSEGPRIRTPGSARWVVRTLEEAGFECWTVGGAVRDALLGIPSNDWDFATAAHPKQTQRVFRRTVPIGIDHGTVGVLDRDGLLHEVTTFRKDVETDGRHAVVSFADRIEDDLARRDFTINAIAWHPIREELLDPYGGVGDLERRELRTVGAATERFQEDYLRILRALRFAGRYELQIVPETWEAARSLIDGLGGLSAERIREELMKVLGSRDPGPALELYRSSGALERVAPALAAADEARWTAAVRRAATIGAHRPVLRLAALLEVALSELSEAARVGGVATWMEGLRFSNADTETVTHLMATSGPLPTAERESTSDAELRRWLARVGPSRVADRVRLAIAAARCGAEEPEDVRARVARIRAMMHSHPPLSVGDLAISGRDLIAMGMKPGPQFGRILEELLDLVLEDPTLNQAELLRARVPQ